MISFFLMRMGKIDCYLNVMFINIKKNPKILIEFVTKQRPINVRIGIRNPNVLNKRRTFNFEIFPVSIILSLITAETTIESQHAKNGIDDNSPFYIFKTKFKYF